MKMKHLLVSLVATMMVVMVAASAGCVSPSNNNKKPATGDKWAAYNFDENVKANSGATGKLKTFKYEEKRVDDNKVVELDVVGSYLGRANEGILANKTVINSATYQTSYSVLTTNVDCFKVKHDITVKRDDTNSGYANTSSVTVWIPTAGFNTTATYFWIYPKAEYSDSNGHAGSWSFYLTSAMQAEMDNPPSGETILFTPVITGTDYIDDAGSLVLWGMYGWAWYWFHGYADGSSEIKEGTVSYNFGGAAYVHSIKKVTRTVGTYTFTAWDISQKWSSAGEGSAEYRIVISEDLAIPFYLKAGGSSSQSTDYYEYELKDLTIG